jgi:lipocalin-like protein
LAISFALPTYAQQANDLVDAWTLVSITLEKDGKKTDFYGPNPQGQLIYDATGHFSVIITRSDLPKFASDNRVAGTPEENKAIVQGSLASFGTYSVNETDKTYTQHVESCTFPNWNGTDQKYSFDISGDELSLQVVSGPLTSIGTGTAYVVWKCAK